MTGTWSHAHRLTRRRLLGLGATAAGGIGAAMLTPPPWGKAFGAAKPYKLGWACSRCRGPRRRGAGPLVGTQMAVDRITVKRLKAVDPSGPLPDRYVQSNFEAVNFLKLGMTRSGFDSRADAPKLIEALEGMEVKEGYDFPQGDKTLRREDHQAFVREFIFEIRNGKHHIVEVVPKERTIVPPACRFA
jgi:hypothetical protein